MPSSFITSVSGRSQTEYIIKKSRFIATVQEVTSEADAAAHIEALRKQYWDASHNCYAYQIGQNGALQKSSDDGEPSGTAGRPMLEILKKSGVTNTLVVVTRYFGGIKLGASGLIRAYSHAAAKALEEADIADYIPYAAVNVTVSYSFISPVERLCLQEKVIIADRTFADVVSFTLHVPLDQADDFIMSVINLTNGTARVAKAGTTIIPIIRTKKPEQP